MDQLLSSLRPPHRRRICLPGLSSTVHNGQRPVLQNPACCLLGRRTMCVLSARPAAPGLCPFLFHWIQKRKNITFPLHPARHLSLLLQNRL